MSEVTYGFVDENNILLNAAVFIEGDVETVERVKNEYKANAYYLMDLTKELVLPGEAYWNGKRFIWPSPNPNYVWSEDVNNWIDPNLPIS